jgi:hypothetical protein
VALDADHEAVDPGADGNYWKAFVAKLELDPSPMLPPKPVFLHSYADAGFQYVNSVVTTPEGDAVFGGLVRPTDGSTGVDYGDGQKIPPAAKDGIGNHNEDGFIAKYCKSGGLRWVKQLSTSASESVRGVAADGAGNTFATGAFSGTYDFGGPKQYSPAGWDPFALRVGP